MRLLKGAQKHGAVLPMIEKYHEHAIVKKMRSRGLRGSEIDAFLRMVDKIEESESGYIPLTGTSTPGSQYIIDAETMTAEMPDLEKRGRAILGQTVVIKLNGGRSTSLGGLVPKGIIPAKNGRCYLDIIAGQIDAFRQKWQANVPLVLMNSFFTNDATQQAAKRFPFDPITFIQHQVPRLREDTLMPMETGTDDDWAPPGHGDIYDSMYRTGLLAQLLLAGKKWAFISNLDNLAACLEPWILGLLEREGIDFLLEVTDRTKSDKKGGTLVVIDGKLVLVEIAQVSPEDRDKFQDIARFKVFNTNNVWINLEALAESMKHSALDLPLIQNYKTILGEKILQLETAMGAAIGQFGRARALRVGRERFFPTKKVGDLFLLQSDACILDEMDRLQPNPKRPKSLPLRPFVFFSSDFIDYPHEMVNRFEDPTTVSLINAHTLDVSGPVYFEKDVTIHGHVLINAAGFENYRIPSGSTLTDGTYP